jgi:hypothetical protein
MPAPHSERYCRGSGRASPSDSHVLGRLNGTQAARERERERRNQAIAKAHAALEKSEREHHKRVATIEAQRNALEKKSDAEASSPCLHLQSVWPANWPTDT